jgi:hypothetical protein
VVSVTPQPRFTPGERTSGTHWIGGWVGPRAGLDARARRKILCPCRGSKPDRPARSQTLYCLSYSGSHLLWNPKVLYSIHMSQPMEPTLNQIDQVHTLIPHSIKMHCSIFLPSMPRSLKCIFPPGFPTKIMCA